MSGFSLLPGLPTPALGLPLPQGALFPDEKALGFSSFFLPYWANSSLNLRLRGSWERVPTPSLYFLQSGFAHPLRVGLDCALVPGVLVLSPSLSAHTP